MNGSVKSCHQQQENKKKTSWVCSRPTMKQSMHKLNKKNVILAENMASKIYKALPETDCLFMTNCSCRYAGFCTLFSYWSFI